MNSPAITPTLNTASRLTHAREGKKFGLAAKMLTICTLLLGLSPFASWASAPVNINLASAEVLAESLQGVGIAKAHRIVEYREAHGPFEHIDELAAVQGIGSTTVEKNRSVIRLQ
jgi:competence protein ComEA